MDAYKIKIQNLINKRQLSIQLFSIVTGGVVGLLFVKFELKTAILFAIGIYYSILLLSNYIKLDKTIDKYTEKIEEEKWYKLFYW